MPVVLQRRTYVAEISEQSCWANNYASCSCVEAGSRTGVHFALVLVGDDGIRVEELYGGGHMHGLALQLILSKLAGKKYDWRSLESDRKNTS